MSSDTSTISTSVCTIVPYQNGLITLKEADGKLSLLGGHIPWEKGYQEGLQQRVREENGIEIEPYHITRITHHKTPSGKNVVNIGSTGVITSFPSRRNIIQISPAEALARKEEFRTPDVYTLISKIFSRHIVPLDFIQVTEVPSGYRTAQIPGQWGRTDFLVGSEILRYERSGNVEYAFMRCQRYNNLLSFFGGKIEEGETIEAGISRERLQESGGKMISHPLGLVGIAVNYVGMYPNQKAPFAVNIASASLIDEKIKEVPDNVKDETSEIVWLNINDIARMKEEEFRTPDTKLMTLRCERAYQKNLFVPFSFIEQV